MLKMQDETLMNKSICVAAYSRQLFWMLKAAALYFALVFGAGFVFGTLRVLFVLPRVGERVAELLEAPLMLIVILFAARWTARKFAHASESLLLLEAGVIAALMVLLADVGVGVGLRGMSPAQVFTKRDAVSGTVYYLMLCAFALMPYLFARRAAKAKAGSID